MSNSKLYDVYHPWNISFVSANGSQLTDTNGKNYLDCYGGHGVISIGHNHESWKEALSQQLNTISYYSNAVKITQQEEVADALERVSGLTNYRLFLCNSGAEANENAMKVAAFQTGRTKMLSFEKAFHGRTVGAIAVTDNPNIVAPFGKSLDQIKIAFNDEEALVRELSTKEYAAVIIEGIQGVAGVFEASTTFWKKLREVCDQTETLLIADEIQSGCGRTGTFCAFQQHGVRADLITMAKGIGNGFPVAAVLIDNKIDPKKGQLGTTFGGSYLACAAMKSVLETIEKEGLIQQTKLFGEWMTKELSSLSGVEEVRGRGLMIGIKTPVKATDLQQLLLEKGVVAGNSTCPNTLRILPPLTISKGELSKFLEVFTEILEDVLTPPLEGAEGGSVPKLKPTNP